MSSKTKLFIDVDSDEPGKSSIHIEGNAGVLADVLVQLFEHQNNKGVVSIFEIAVEEYYKKHPEQKES